MAISIGTEIMVRAERASWTYARSALAGHPRGARRLDTAEQEQINTTVRTLTPQVVAAGCQSAPGLLRSTSIHGASERRATLPCRRSLGQTCKMVPIAEVAPDSQGDSRLAPVARASSLEKTRIALLANY